MKICFFLSWFLFSNVISFNLRIPDCLISRLPYLEAAGLIQKWTEDQIQEATSSSNNEQQSKTNSNAGPGALTLTNLQGAFLVSGIGVVTSMIALLIEIIMDKII